MIVWQQYLSHGWEAKPSMPGQDGAGSSWWLLMVSHSCWVNDFPCSSQGTAFNGVPALPSCLVIFITSLQSWAQSCNSIRSLVSPLIKKQVRKSSTLTALETGAGTQRVLLPVVVGRRPKSYLTVRPQRGLLWDPGIAALEQCQNTDSPPGFPPGW